MHRECKQREKTQSPAGWERDKTAESFPKTNFNILHCTTAPKEVTHAEIFFSSKQKTFLDHCCCNLFFRLSSRCNLWNFEGCVRECCLRRQLYLQTANTAGFLFHITATRPDAQKCSKKSEKGEIGCKNAFNSHGRMSANRKYERYHVNFLQPFVWIFGKAQKYFSTNLGSPVMLMNKMSRILTMFLLLVFCRVIPTGWRTADQLVKCHGRLQDSSLRPATIHLMIRR